MRHPAGLRNAGSECQYLWIVRADTHRRLPPARFQSYSSPIKSLQRKFPSRLVGKFQSYSSPIKSRCRVRQWGPWASFNPTVVRLKEHQAQQVCSRKPSFNPTVVRLKALVRLPVEPPTIRFNPTVVRLKVWKRGGKKRVGLMFQSYSSPIKRLQTALSRA